MENRKKQKARKKYLIFIAVLSLVVISAVSVQIHKSTLLMPGPLSENHDEGTEIEGFVSHAEFEEDCSHCHGPIHCVEDSRCQDCHFEVAQQRVSLTGLHGRLPGMRQCENCHPEHNGREAHITTFAYNNVNHMLLAGFSLDLHHFDYNEEPLNCQSCHSQDSYLTERLDCITCHAGADHDFIASHLEMFGADCIACHDGIDCYSGFDHADYYPLEGAHEDLDCEACHQEKQYVGISNDCGSCHEGKMFVDIFGQSCDRCHSVTSWIPAELKHHTFIVDHGVKYSPTCDTCHIHTYTEYTCCSCHDLDEMKASHHNLEDHLIESCNECHITGSETELLQLKREYLENTDLEMGQTKGQTSSLQIFHFWSDTQTNNPDSFLTNQKNDKLITLNHPKDIDGSEGSS